MDYNSFVLSTISLIASIMAGALVSTAINYKKRIEMLANQKPEPKPEPMACRSKSTPEPIYEVWINNKTAELVVITEGDYLPVNSRGWGFLGLL